MKIIIFGAGSIGCYVGGRLAAAALDVTLYGREPMGEIIRTHGLRLTHYQTPPLRIAHIPYVSDLKKLPTADLVIVCVKSQDTKQAAAQIAKHVAPSTPVLSLQNGVENVGTLKTGLVGRRIYGAVVPYNVLGMGEGRFHQGTAGALVFESAPQMQTLVDALNTERVQAKLTDDIASVQWGKLLINLNNALNALADIPLKAQFAQKGYRLVWAQMIEEGLAVLTAQGITPGNFGKTAPKKMCALLRLPTFLFTPIMAMRVKIDPNARSSMWEDLQKGRKPEIDYLQGTISALGKKTGIATPVNDKIYTLVQQAFKAGASPSISGRDIRAVMSL